MTQITLCGSHIFLFSNETLYEIDGMHKDSEGFYVMNDEMEVVERSDFLNLYDEFSQSIDSTEDPFVNNNCFEEWSSVHHGLCLPAESSKNQADDN